MVKPKAFIDPLSDQRQNKIIRRVSMIGVIIICALAVRFFQLQVLEGQELRRRAMRQSSRSVVTLPQRGLILDRSGKTIVGNQPGFRLRLFPDAVADAEGTYKFLVNMLAHVPADLKKRFERGMRRRPYRPETLVDLLSRDDLATMAAHSYEYPQLQIQTIPIRRYPHHDLAAHMLGYLGEINDDELKQHNNMGLYAPGDLIGKLGLERYYDAVLFGTKGREIYRVDASGRVQELIDRQKTEPGRDLMLTLDLPTQVVAERELAGKRGAVVALDVNTGEILAMVSEPSFNPEQFIGGINHHDWNQLRDDPGHPLEYRPVRGQYPPGSTFKPLVALAALEENIISPNETVFCPGYYRMGRRTFRCWRPGGHGKVDLHKAIKVSCDTYFYELGKQLGIESLAEYGRLYGFGALTGLDLGGEKPGLMPTPEWKLRTRNEPWQDGETVINAIGQGFVLSTPLQLARFYALLANGNHLPTPHLRKQFVNTYRPSVTEPQSLSRARQVKLNVDHLSLVQESLIAVVNEKGGTGGYARLKNVVVAGKTGTAQIVKQDKREAELAEHLRDHAWFAAYAPADDPKIAIAVIVENGGHGGSVAAPIARRVIETYLRL